MKEISISVLISMVLALAFQVYLVVQIEYREVTESSINIYSVQTVNNIEGKFVMYRGEVNEKTYFYVYQESSGSKKLVKYDTDSTYVKDILNPDVQPYVSETYVVGTRGGKEVSKELKYRTLCVPKGYLEQTYDFKVQ